MMGCQHPDRLLQQYTAPKAILSGIAILLAVRPVLRFLCDYPCDQINQAAKGVTSGLDAPVDLLEYFGRFLSRLDIYATVPRTPAMDEIVVKIMLDLLAILALVTKELKQGQSSESGLADASPYCH